MQAKLPTAGIVIYPNPDLFIFSVPYRMLTLEELGTPLFDLKFFQAFPGPCEAPPNPLVNLRIEDSLEELAELDLIVIPGWMDLNAPPSEELSCALRKAYKRGAVIAGLCYGAYVLAYAGLLDGKEAATHWMAEEDFSRRFPKVRLNSNVLYCVQDNLITSAGAGAGIDCCFYLISRFYGGRKANEIARTLILPPHREGGQAQYIKRALPDGRYDIKLSALIKRLQEDPSAAVTSAQAADEVFMSERSFNRHFKAATGLSFGKWLTGCRLNLACELLESSRMSINEVSAECGFASPEAFRQCFKERFKVSPANWRKSFSTVED